ncbi:MAG: hypothetical protein USCGTAYLOR_02999 [Chromatiales bacterium USCg_Taylor]|nr:MAG: hypothetical protein USCGTAYLOR_02999 [Chromatiales bacterium USCg_Taylor]
MMGYWGEAMAHDHPIWGDPQETEAARKVIAKIRITPGLTQRERAYIDAAKLLYGEGDRQARDQAYAEAMKRIYREYPDDLEAAGFYSLALLGSVEPQEPAVLQTRMRAAGIAMEVYRKIRTTRSWRSPPRNAMPKSLPTRLMRCTCLRTFSYSSGCGKKPQNRTRLRGRLQKNGSSKTI